MNKIRVLIVDDSPLIRTVIKKTLLTAPDFEIVGEAKNGKEAVEMVAILKPDIVTMDIHMPVMNGADAIQEIMAENAVPIIVISSMGESVKAFDLISMGALDVMLKDKINYGNPEEFVRKIRVYSKVKVISHRKKKDSADSAQAAVDVGFRKVIAIASSTGGPKALSAIFSALDETFPYPILVAQHIEHDFIDGFIEWMNKTTKMKVVKGKEGEKIKAGTIYISPADKNMVLAPGNRINLIERESTDIYSPSCNKLLFSVSKVYGSKAVGVILTGMGDDGAKGIQEIKRNGGLTIAQDEASCVVFGMPNIAIQYGAVDKILSLEKISPEILSLV